MEINSFSSLLELAAGLNIAFVAVEYSKSYTQTLSDKVFKFPEIIDSSFKGCYEVLCEKETLNNLDPIEINGKSTLPEIEKNKREFEILETSIKKEEASLKVNIHKLCESKSFSSLCLWNFLFSTFALLLCGFESTPFIFMLFYMVSFFTLLFDIIGWIRGEGKPKVFKYLDYSLLRHTIFAFLIAIVLSFIINCIVYEKIEIPQTLVSICVLIPYINFIAFFLIIRNKVKKIKSEITTTAISYEAKCTDLKQAVDNLLAANKVGNQLTMSNLNPNLLLCQEIGIVKNILSSSFIFSLSTSSPK